MMMKSFISALLPRHLCLVASLPAQPAFAQALRIRSGDHPGHSGLPGCGQITIVGVNFPDLAKLRVSLGEFGQLNVVAVSPDHHTIVADLPGSIGPGDYILTAYKEKKGPFCESESEQVLRRI
jgi:hypothetical protein